MFRTRRPLVPLVLSAVLSLGLVTACGSDDGGGDSGSDADNGSQTDDASGQEGDASDGEADRDAEVDRGDLLAATEATLHTNFGEIKLTLFPEESPVTVDNFLGLADGSHEWDGQEDGEPLYQDVIFHRVIDGFMIQGGDPEGTGFGGPGYQFEDETDSDLVFDNPYKLAMANAGPNTNGSQFFITVVPTPSLDGRHTIFGEVADADSQAVVDAIATTETDASDKPVEDVVLESVSIGE